MTNSEKILRVLRDAIRNLEHDGQLAAVLAAVARCDHLPSGVNMYGLWCDDCGACTSSGDEECNDERHMACIQRFLDGEYSEGSYLSEILNFVPE